MEKQDISNDVWGKYRQQIPEEKYTYGLTKNPLIDFNRNKQYDDRDINNVIQLLKIARELMTDNGIINKYDLIDIYELKKQGIRHGITEKRFNKIFDVFIFCAFSFRQNKDNKFLGCALEMYNGRFSE